MALVGGPEEEGRGPIDGQAVERRAEDEGARLEAGRPGAEGLDPRRAPAEQGGPRALPGELGDVGVPALGVGGDGHPEGVLGGVPGDRLQAVEPDQRLARREGQALGGGQADPEPGVGAGAEADGDGVEVGRPDPLGLEQGGDRGDQPPAVPAIGVGRGDPAWPPGRPSATAARGVEVSMARMIKILGSRP